MAGSWFQVGYEAVVAESARITSFRQPRRFFLKPGKTGDVVYVDDDATSFYEHSYRRNGDWHELSCSSPLKIDACCRRLGEPYYVGLYTVVDCSRYTGQDGKVYQFELKAFAAKIGSLQTLRRKRQTLVSFAYRKCCIARDTDKSPASGNDFTFGDEVKDHDKLFAITNYKGKLLKDLYDAAESDPEEFQKLSKTFQFQRDGEGRLVRRVPAFNYEVLYMPHSEEEIQRILSGEILAGGDFNKQQPGKPGTGPGPGGAAGGNTQGVDF